MVDTELLKISLVFLCIGGAFTFLAVNNWQGRKHSRSSYLLFDRPFRERGVEFQIYGSIPASIMFILLGIALLFGSLGFDPFGKFLFWTSLLAGAFTLFLLIWQPDWIKPPWMKNFERKNQDIMDIFFKETHGEFERCRKQGDKTWFKSLSTDQGMDNWANEMGAVTLSSQQRIARESVYFCHEFH